jgi:hypothetical protein
MIVPLNYFIEQPFQNWTRESAALIGTVLLYVDFTVKVAELREKFEEIVRGSKLWDGRVLALQVTDLKESTMEVRMLVSASSAARAFDLRCEVREKMIAYMQQLQPEALPRVRTDLSDQRAGPDGRRRIERFSGKWRRDQGWPKAPILASFSSVARENGDARGLPDRCPGSSGPSLGFGGRPGSRPGLGPAAASDAPGADAHPLLAACHARADPRAPRRAAFGCTRSVSSCRSAGGDARGGAASGRGPPGANAGRSRGRKHPLDPGRSRPAQERA